MNLLKTFKSNGLWLFATMFVIVDLIIIFGIETIRANWTIFWIEILALFFYVISQSITGKDDTLWFFKSKDL